MNLPNPFTQPYPQRQTPHHVFDFRTLMNGSPTQLIEEGFNNSLNQSQARFSTLMSKASELPLKELLNQIEWVFEPIDEFTGIFNVIYATKADDSIRELAQKVFPEVTKFRTTVFSNPNLYQALNQKASLVTNLDPVDQRMVSELIKIFKDHGAHLSESQRARLVELEMKLESLSLQFNDHVVKATDTIVWQGPDSTPWLSDLPAQLVEQGRELARQKGLSNLVAFSLLMPFYLGILKHCSNREIRQLFWEAYNSRGLKDPYQNIDLIKSILVTRTQLADLLGYSTYADWVLADRMAGSSEKVWEFLNHLKSVYHPAALRDLEELQKLARQDQISELMPWDVSYYQEKLKQKELQLDDEVLKEYFPLPRVMQGIQTLAKTVFGFDFVANPQIPTYHPDVTAYEVWDVDSGQLAGVVYFDLFARSGKSQGAWMDDFQPKGIWSDGYRPAHILVAANFSPPAPGEMALLTVTEVTTLFHEMGHALHGLASTVSRRFLGGTRVKWDFVELPSQLLENWVFEPSFVQSWALHVKTGEPIPASILESLKRYQQFQSGYFGLRQVTFGWLDMSYHHRRWNNEDPFDPIQWEQTHVGLLWPWKGQTRTNQSTHFTHIFAGGYAAGYYSYKWAEVLEANAWDVFLQEGILNPNTGRRFKKTILSQGNAQPPELLFEQFARSKPRIETLFRKEGLL